VPYWINTEEEGRKAVDELSEKKVDIVKIWVDTRGNKYKKLTPEIYAAIIDEAHKRDLRVTAHIFDLEDAKGLLRANIDALAHGVRDKDIDDEFLDLVKQRPNLVLTPNLPDRGVKTDRTWLKPGLAAAEFEKLEKANTDRPAAQAFFGIQARNLAKMNAAGVRVTLGTDGNRAWAPHEEMADMVTAGMTPMQVIVAATRNSADFLKLSDAAPWTRARAPTSSCSTPIRSTTSRTPGVLQRWSCAAPRWTAPIRCNSIETLIGRGGPCARPLRGRPVAPLQTVASDMRRAIRSCPCLPSRPNIVAFPSASWATTILRLGPTSSRSVRMIVCVCSAR
jgi:hypothetical protein